MLHCYLLIFELGKSSQIQHTKKNWHTAHYTMTCMIFQRMVNEMHDCPWLFSMFSTFILRRRKLQNWKKVHLPCSSSISGAPCSLNIGSHQRVWTRQTQCLPASCLKIKGEGKKSHLGFKVSVTAFVSDRWISSLLQGNYNNNKSDEVLFTQSKYNSISLIIVSRRLAWDLYHLLWHASVSCALHNTCWCLRF